MDDGRVLLWDNGAHTIKTLWSDSNDTPPTLFRNAVVRSKQDRRNYVADELDDECLDYGALVFRLAFDRGILNNWDVEKTVWDRVIGSKGRGLHIDPLQTNLLITEPLFNFPNVQDHYDQIIFEEYDFASCLRTPGPALAPYGQAALGDGQTQPECVLVVDSGFSFTHVVPVVQGSVVSQGVQRIDVGGKLLTNHLKELVSFRQWYMMDQTSVMEHAKETACYISLDWARDWDLASTTSKNTSIVRTYVLPDFVPNSSNKLGYVREPIRSTNENDTRTNDSRARNGISAALSTRDEQLLHMSNERFAVPEVLFNPSIIGLKQAGLVEAISNSISSMPLDLQAMLWANIVCVGGNTSFPGFVERIKRDLRPFAPDDCDISVRSSQEPTLETILSARRALELCPTLRKEMFLSRSEYLEVGAGSNAARRKFGKLYLSNANIF